MRVRVDERRHDRHAAEICGSGRTLFANGNDAAVLN
jgi:hypothetical protein